MRYEFDGKKYERASTHQKEWGQKLLKELNLSGSERILDLGCGDGALTARLADLVPRGSVLGIDGSRGMIAAATEHRRDNLRFELLDINDLAFEEEFDIIFSNATLHWIQNHEALLENVYRALKPGGLLRLNFAGDGNCSHFFEVIRRAISDPLFKRHFSQFSWPWYMPAIEEYTTLIDRHPFREARVWGENADRYFADEKALIAWLDQPSLVPFIACVAEEEKAPFRDWVIAEMLRQTRQEDGRCFETFRRINVMARK